MGLQDGGRGSANAPGWSRSLYQAEAARRARSTLRRYAASNRLNHLGTLTHGPPRCSDPRQVREHAGQCFRALRATLGGKPFPYIWVPELHKGGEHFHLHFAVGKYIRRSRIEGAWGRGFVHITLLGDLPVGSGAVEEARRAAGYLSKYVSKAFADTPKRTGGMHRYEVGEGFTPEPVRFYGARSSAEAIARASAVLGAEPVRHWSSSSDVAGWSAPPAVWVQWAG